METAILKNKNIHVRLSADVKNRIEKAANILGQSLTDFVINASTSQAEKVLERRHFTTLTDRDRDRLLAFLDADAEPTEALRQAAKSHKTLISE